MTAEATISLSQLSLGSESSGEFRNTALIESFVRAALYSSVLTNLFLFIIKLSDLPLTNQSNLSDEL